MQLCARARPLFSSPFSLTFSPTKQFSNRLNLRGFPSKSSSRFVSAVAMSSTPQIIEHVVLFKVKEGTDSGKINSMIDGLNGLVSLDLAAHLTAGPVHRARSAVGSGFTHMLHSRYRSKDDLGAYSAHPHHISVVKEMVFPICDDVMAVDWVIDRVPETLAPPPGSSARITFLKLKENVPDDAKREVLDVIKGLKEKFPGIDQMTFGENFSPARAKGFSIASIAVCKDLSELEAFDAQQEFVNLQKEKVRDFLDGVIVVDYVVPSSSQPSSSSL